jgi:tripartite-type tricarboxylate transporter receptor subunit TctC
MHGEINALLDAPDMRQRLDQQGAMPEKMSPQGFGKLMSEETNKWLDVIRRADIRGE